METKNRRDKVYCCKDFTSTTWELRTVSFSTKRNPISKTSPAVYTFIRMPHTIISVRLTLKYYLQFYFAKCLQNLRWTILVPHLQKFSTKIMVSKFKAKPTFKFQLQFIFSRIIFVTMVVFHSIESWMGFIYCIVSLASNLNKIRVSF